MRLYCPPCIDEDTWELGFFPRSHKPVKWRWKVRAVLLPESRLSAQQATSHGRSEVLRSFPWLCLPHLNPLSFLKSFVPTKLSSLMTHACHLHGSVFVGVSSLGVLAPLLSACQSQCTSRPHVCLRLCPLLSSTPQPWSQNSACNSSLFALAVAMYSVTMSMSSGTLVLTISLKFLSENFISKNFIWNLTEMFLIKLEESEYFTHHLSSGAR